MNVDTGKECTIRGLAETIRDVVYEDVAASGSTCRMVWDSAKPNGTSRKLCDVNRLNALGWKAKVDLQEGLKIAYNDFLHGDMRKQKTEVSFLRHFLIQRGNAFFDC